MGNGHTALSSAPAAAHQSESTLTPQTELSDAKAAEVAKLKAAVKHLKEEILHITQACRTPPKSYPYAQHLNSAENRVLGCLNVSYLCVLSARNTSGI
jgi:hypothetical protein